MLKAIEIMTREKSCKEIGILESKTEFTEFSEKENFHFNTNELALRFFGDEENLVENAALHYKSRQHERGKATTDERARMWGQSKTNQAAYLVATGNMIVLSPAALLQLLMSSGQACKEWASVKASKLLVALSLWFEKSKNFCLRIVRLLSTPHQSSFATSPGFSGYIQKPISQQRPQKVAFLSFSTNGSADHPMTQKVVQGYRLFSEKHPTIQAQGEIQFDAAYVSEIAEKKFPDSNIRGDANIFVFPNLDAGNISYKLCQRIGGFDAYGPLLQGTAKSVSDLSRGASDGGT